MCVHGCSVTFVHTAHVCRLRISVHVRELAVAQRTMWEAKMPFDKVKPASPLQIITRWLKGYLSVTSYPECAVDCLTRPYLCDIWVCARCCSVPGNSSLLSHTPQAAPDRSNQSARHLIDVLFLLIKTRKQLLPQLQSSPCIHLSQISQ